MKLHTIIFVTFNSSLPRGQILPKQSTAESVCTISRWDSVVAKSGTQSFRITCLINKKLDEIEFLIYSKINNRPSEKGRIIRPSNGG